MPQLKTYEEMQVAHDTLHRLVAGQFFDNLCETARTGVRAQLSVLCWILGHRAGCLFQHNLDAVIKFDQAHDGLVECKETVH